MKRKIVLRCAAVVCAAVAAASLCKTAGIIHDYKTGEAAYSELADLLVSDPAAELYVTEGGPDTETPVDVNFEMLKEINADAVGWLYCEGTPINYPVVQSGDNSYYLNRLYDEQTNSTGAIFMDADNAPDLSDINTVIYGHNMKNGTMFASLAEYESQDYYDAHPVMYYITPERSYRIDVFASYETTGDSDAFTIFFDSEQTYDNYLRTAWDRSDIDTSGLPMSTDDNIVTLSTCSYGFDNARYVVQGKVTPVN